MAASCRCRYGRLNGHDALVGQPDCPRAHRRHRPLRLGPAHDGAAVDAKVVGQIGLPAPAVQQLAQGLQSDVGVMAWAMRPILGMIQCVLWLSSMDQLGDPPQLSRHRLSLAQPGDTQRATSLIPWAWHAAGCLKACPAARDDRGSAVGSP